MTEAIFMFVGVQREYEKGSKTCCARWHLWSCRQRNPQEEQILQQGQEQEQEELLLPEQVPPPPLLHPRMIRTPVPAPSLRPHLQVAIHYQNAHGIYANIRYFNIFRIITYGVNNTHRR
jgi:hypothetical protein